MTDQEQQDQENTTLSVYITGGATQYGQAVIRQLIADGHSVGALVQTAADAHAIRELGALPVYGDETDTAAMRQNIKMLDATTVIHLAPQQFNTAPLVRRDWDAATAAFVTQTDALLDAVAQTDVGYIIHTSYAFLYADTGGEAVAEGAPARETGAPLFPAALEAERRVLEMGGCVLRAGYLYGGSDDSVLHDVHRMLRRGLPILHPDPNKMANWLREDELTAAVLAAVEKQPESKLYNIVEDTPLSLHGFLTHFAQKLGLAVPAKMPAFAARNMYGKTHFALLNADVALKNDAAQADLDWAPAFTNVDDSLDDVLLTWRASEPVG